MFVLETSRIEKSKLFSDDEPTTATSCELRATLRADGITVLMYDVVTSTPPKGSVSVFKK
jgi:hypothetical protein